MSRPIRYCTVPGCGTRRESKGLCQRHYFQMRRNGYISHVQPCTIKRVAWLLRDLPGESFTVRSASQRLGFNEQTVRTELARLHEEGKVDRHFERDGTARWYVYRWNEHQ